MARFKSMRMMWLSVVSALWLTACAVAPPIAPELRPLNWAQPVASVAQVQDFPNLHQVSPTLYRSAQPAVEGLNLLNQGQARAQGFPVNINTVLTLRNNGGDAALVSGKGAVRFIQIPFNTWHVKESDVIAFLKMARDPAYQPLLLHCKHGSDRTGMMVALYRVVEQGWTKEQAIAEMTQGGFGYHPIWSNLIRYIERADIEKLKRLSAPLNVPLNVPLSAPQS